MLFLLSHNRKTNAKFILIKQITSRINVATETTKKDEKDLKEVKFFG